MMSTVGKISLNFMKISICVMMSDIDFKALEINKF